MADVVPGKPIPPADLSPEEDAPDSLSGGPLVAVGRSPKQGRLVDMLDGPVTYRTLFWLALPTLAEQVIHGIVALTDTLVAGHGKDEMHNAASAAAVGTMTFLQWFCGLMGGAVGVGATAIVARSIGAGRTRVAQRVAGTALSAALILGLGVGLVLFVCAPYIVWGFGLKGDAYTFGVQYLRIMSATVCFQTIGQIGLACLRGAGDLVRPMLVAATIMVVNLILVPSLAYGWFGLPAWGIQGNAVGTMMAFAISGIITMWMLFSGKASVKLERRHIRIVPHVLWRVMRISLPSWLEGVLLWGGQFAVVFVINRLNDAALAERYGMPLEKISGMTMSTHNAVLRVESFAFLPGFGIGMATSALVGQYLGARRPADARHATLVATRLAVWTMTILALPMMVFPTLMMRLMMDNTHTAEIGFWPMILAGAAQPSFAVAIIMGSALKGAGDTVSAMISTLLGMFLVRFPVLLGCVWLFTWMGHPEWALIAVWIGIFADLNFRAALNTAVFMRGKWMDKKV